MLHPPRHECKTQAPHHPPADALNEAQMCLRSSHSDHGHCLCWRQKEGHCCDCRQPLAPHVGLRVDATDIPERTQGEVVEVTAGGYFTVRYDDGSKFKNYPPRSAAYFTYLGEATTQSDGDIPDQPPEAYSSCSAGHDQP